MFGRFLGSSRRTRVLKLLDEERDILLNGPLAALAPLVERREKALAEVRSSGQDLPMEFVAAVKSRAERNGRLLQASLEGVRAARKELQTITASAGKLGVYTTDGAPAPKPVPRITRDQRA